MHVSTDEGIEGMCTVGDVRYTALAVDDLEQLRLLVIGEDPFDRERLYARLRRATRHMFTGLGWFGAFDNCLWDIAGKAAGLPVSVLVGRVRDAAPAYYNIRGDSIEAVIADTRAAIAAGFPAIKDHFHRSGRENASWCEAVRSAVGDDIDLMHDAAGCDYSFAEAADLGQALERLDYRWFEEPLPDRHQERLAELCRRLDIPVLSAETLMNDVDLSAQWLISGTTDLLRANARHGLTPALKLSHLAELHGTNIEFNGPGGLFGIVHAHVVCSIVNTSYYEYFPGGTRDEEGKAIGLLNPAVPVQGQISPPGGPGWGAEWDRAYFEKVRVAVL